MVRFSIRCHSCVPVSADELERWLEDRVDDIRADAPQGIIRTSRLTQSLPSGDFEIGWLIEVELPDAGHSLYGEWLTDTLTGIRRLGLHPTLLMPHDPSDGATRRPGTASVAVGPDARPIEVVS